MNDTVQAKPGAVVDVRAGARQLVELGWSVLLSRPGRKDPATAHGVYDATADLQKILEAIAGCPAANLAVAPGAGDVVVIDVDPPGIPAWRSLLAEHPDTTRSPMVVATPRGGWHLYWKHPEPGLQLAGRLAAGIDVKTAGGITLVPPSMVGGVAYRWIGGPCRPEDLPTLPEWMLDVLRPRRGAVRAAAALAAPAAGGRAHRYVHAALAREVQAVIDAEPGSRNTTLNRAAFSIGTLIATGYPLPVDDATRALEAAGEATGLDPREVRRTVTSGLNAGIGRPRITAVPA